MEDIKPSQPTATPAANNNQGVQSAPPVTTSEAVSVPVQVESPEPAKELATETVAVSTPQPVESIAQPVIAPSEPVVAAMTMPLEAEAVLSVAPMAVDAKKKRSPMMLITAVMLVVVIALAVIAFFALGKKDSTSLKPSKATVANSATETSAVKDPGAVSTTIDTNLTAIDETKDYNPDALTDATLGL